MGRTNPTYRMWLERFEQEWAPFRRALRQRWQGDFDRLFEKANQHADAAGFANAVDPREGAVLSILLAQERENRELKVRVSELEAQITEE